ncbi:MAG: Gfo/Idh/MocA family oxidoreductase [bacterium]|jgi:predicted dehydrogenase|nr:Gfo/Idh/MocA family oxidoreductase [bacterium]
MTEKKGMTRREFMSRTAKTAAIAAMTTGPAINVLGANDTMQLGLIGYGRRGSFLMDQTHRMMAKSKKPVEFIGVADIFEGWRDMGKDAAERVADKCAGYDHHMKLLENKDIVGVIIATPEHQHAKQMLDAIAAGKHIYAEKPMVHTVEEGKQVVKAANGSSCIIQVGTHRRSVDLFYEARDLVKSGAIGEVTFCEGWWHRNFKPGSKDAAWRYEIPEDANENTINWKEFHYTAKPAPFDTGRYFQWRCYEEYSNGIGSDLMVHQIDAINLVMGTTMPKSVVSSGATYKWKDGRTNPDTWSSILEYEEGFQLNYHSRFSNCNEEYGIKICGTLATIVIDRHFIMDVIPEAAYVLPEGVEVKPLHKQTHQRPVDSHNDAVQKHIENWYDCILAKKKETNCDVLTGHYGSAIAHMAVAAYQQKCELVWDKKAENFKKA